MCLDLFFKILLFQVTFLIFLLIAIFSSYFLLVGLLLQYVTWFQSGIYLIKSPRYTGGDFMFLYRFVRRRPRLRLRRQPQLLVHAITFEQLFGFLSFLARLLALTYRLPDWILVDFRRDLDLDFFKVKYGICCISAKNGPIATKRKANISIELQGLKCDHQVWPWPWPWPWIFKVKYGICCISAKSGPIATKRKANIWIELQASNVTNGFDLDHNLDLWHSKVKPDLDLWPHTWTWPWIFMVKFRNSCISEWEGRSTLHKGCGSRSFMTMTVTIWWLSSGVWIYQIVTGVTSVVGVPSTHLVIWGIVNWCRVAISNDKST